MKPQWFAIRKKATKVDKMKEILDKIDDDNVGSQDMVAIDLLYCNKSLLLIEKKSRNYLISMKFSVFIYQLMHFKIH